MISKTTGDYWRCFNGLPMAIQAVAKEKFRIWQNDSFHPSLHFKPLFANVWSVRINQNYRALGRRSDEMIVWFWIGTHAEYDHLIERLIRLE